MYTAFLRRFYLLFSYFPFVINGDNGFGLCGNPTCSVPVGHGVTLMKYTSPDDYRLTFGPNEEVEIYVKDYGPKKDLWGVMLNGHKGYISKQFIREVASNNKNLVPAANEFKNENLISSSYKVTSQVYVSSQWVNPDQRLNSETQFLSQSFDYSQSLQAEVMNSPFLSSNYEVEGLRSPENGPPTVYTSSFAQNNIDGSFQAQLQSSVQILNNPNPSHVSVMPQDAPPPSSSFVPVMSQPESVLSQPESVLSQPESVLSQPESVLPSSSHMPNVRETTAPYQQVVISHSSDFPQHSHHISVQNNLGNPGEMFHSNIHLNGIYPSNNMLPGSVSHQTPFTESMLHIQTHVPQKQQQGYYSESPIATHPDISHREHFSDPYISSQHVSQQHVSQTYGHMESINSVGDADFSKTLSILRDQGVPEAEMLINPNQPNMNPNGFPSSQNWHVEEKQVQHQHEISFPSQSEYGTYHKSEPSPLYGFSNHLQSNGPSAENTVFPSVPHKEEKISQTSFPRNLHNVEEQDDKNIEREAIYNDEEDADDDESDEDDVADHGNVNEADQINIYKSESMTVSNTFSSEASFLHGHTENSDLSNLKSDVSKETFEESASYAVSATALPDHVHASQNVKPKHETVHKQEGNKDVLHEIDIALDDKNGPADSMFIKNDNNIQAESDLLNKIKESPNVENESTSTLDDAQNSDLDKLLNRANLDETETEDDRSSYQIRNLKGEYIKGDQTVDTEVGSEENTTQEDFSSYNSFENSLEALRSFIEALMLWIPEPLYSAIMDLDRKGIPPRVPVFTALSAVPCILLIISLVYIKERSKENKLIAQLMVAEKNIYTLTAEKNALEEKLENVESEQMSLKTSVEEEKNSIDELRKNLKEQQNCLEVAESEIEKHIEEIKSLKQKENKSLSILRDYERQKAELLEQKNVLENELKDKENFLSDLTHQSQEAKNELNEIQKEKLVYIQSKEDFEEKITQLQQNCSQLLQEAEVWNTRVNELNAKLSKEVSMKEELESDLKTKVGEIESLKLLVETLKDFDEAEIPEDEVKSKEEKLQFLINSSSVLAKLERQEEENKLLSEKLTEEKNKILDMEVEILDSRSEVDKLKLNYNQALQDKAEAQTKLEVLTNYFKDKEIQLQKQLGAQEAVRQKKEEDASSAERRICLIEQENASYKYQVASMKQEMEETERNLKSQIASQEKKAHENWIAARAAERKFEDMKQEVTQLRQRLTLLEREQENWTNLTRDEIIRPVPKRIPGLNDESNSSQEINTSLDIRHGMFPPQLHERMPHPLMLPPDRPLPPLPPPPIPPFLPPLDPHFRNQPWHFPPDSVQSADFRTTPPEFLRGRESTPPRGRQSAVTDGDMGPHASSPVGADTRDSRNSTPPHSLPDFHDIPPQPPRSFLPPPPMHHSRFPLPPPFRRDVTQGSKRADSQYEYNSSTRGTQQPSVPQERWQHSNTRV